jgi:hypothetical protein
MDYWMINWYTSEPEAWQCMKKEPDNRYSKFRINYWFYMTMEFGKYGHVLSLEA